MRRSSFDRSLCLTFGLILSLYGKLAWSFSTGAPSNPEVCESFLPDHQVQVQTSPSPFKAVLNTTLLKGGDTLHIKLSANGTKFKGFLVAVKQSGNSKQSFHPEEFVGTFINGPLGESDMTQAINCLGGDRNAITHNSPEDKNEVNLYWVAPFNKNLSDLKLIYTVVQEKTKFWQSFQKLSVLRVNSSSKVIFPDESAKETGNGMSTGLHSKLKETYDHCKNGTKYGCFGIPDNCVQKFLADSKNPPCTVMLSWTADGDRNSYHLTGTPESSEGYLAMGFSNDTQMGGDSVVGCFASSRSMVSIGRFENPVDEEKYNQAYKDLSYGLSNTKAEIIDGYFFCSFEQSDHYIEGLMNIEIRKTKYHILLARGTSGSTERLRKHGSDDKDTGYSDEKVDITFTGILGKEVAPTNHIHKSGPVSQELNSKLKDKYRQCAQGQSGCMGIPQGCIEQFLSGDSASPCTVMLSWSSNGDRNSYLLAGKPEKSSGYLAMAFSDDEDMGTDSVVGCFGSSSGNPSIGRFENPKGKKYNTAHKDFNLGLSNTKAEIIDGHFFCSFEQSDHSIDGLMKIEIRKLQYHILLARGDSGSAGGLRKHKSSDADIGKSAEKVNIHFKGIVGTSSSSVFIKVHGALMVFAWLVCASSGMFTARYYKLTHTEVMPFKKAVWFVIHLGCMFMTVCLTAIGAVFIFVHKKGFAPEDGKYWHPILGVILFCLAVLQVTIAFFRPHPGTEFRPLFNWVHWTIGNSAHIVGIVCILLAYSLDSAQLDDRYLSVGIVALAFHILMHLTLSYHTYFTDKEMGVAEDKVKRALSAGPMKSNGQSTEAPGTSFRMLMMGLYIVGLLGCAIALVVFISFPQPMKTQ